MLHFRLASERMPFFMQYGVLLCAYEIEYARITKGEVKVYCKNSKGVSFIVDLMSKGSTNFIKRLQKENINIIDQREEKGSNDI